MKTILTERQQQILNFISDSIENNGFPPTYREIGAQFDISSTFGVKRHIDALIKKGYLNSESNTSRTLSLVHESPPEIIELPVVGRVAAGYPILAEENIEGSIAINASLVSRNSQCFGLKVKGDSMIDAGIFEGDVVIVSPQSDARNGEIVVAMLYDEATLKRFEYNNQIIRLLPENKNYSPIEVKDKESFSIVGKVLGVFRWYN
ncbi:MAG: transcriptional repressor LexA [Bacteroidetes bacterium]|nr:transcriptional repressor LexA [Bacteroidota bacterium]MBU2505904.1 transcriptional repressor LexA [Bacteroidota bacterium]